MKLKAGDVFEGKYKVVRLLGQGGMGAVYETEHVRVPGRYALKIMLPELGEDPTFQERFFREISIARELVHPNVVTVRDCDVTSEKICYYTMDLSPGVPLTKIAKEPIEWRRALGLIRQLLLALGEAHRRGVVHRDVKPDNVLVESLQPGGSGGGFPLPGGSTAPNELVKVLDFGIARAFSGPRNESDPELTVNAGIVGTPAYISPEQALGERVDGRADLYAVGCTLHRIVTGTLPFKSETPTGFYGQHIAVPPPPIRTVRPEARYPEQLERFILRSLEKAKEKRFATADEMIEEIDRMLGAARSAAGGMAGLAAAAPHASAGRLSAMPTGGFDRAKLVVYGQETNATPKKIFLFSLDKAPFGRARPRPGVAGENVIVLWLLPARSEREDPENFKATLEISGRHGELSLDGQGAYVTDTSSRGSRIDGHPIEKGRAIRLPERFTLDLAGVLALEGRTVAGGARGVVLRRLRNCDHHQYALLKGEASIGAGASASIQIPGAAPEEAILVPKGGSGFAIKPGRSTGAKVMRQGKTIPAGEGVALLFGDELQIGPCSARFEPLDEADFREP